MTKTKQTPQVETTTKNNKKSNYSKKNVIIGVLMLVSVLSIAYSTTTVVIETTGWIPVVLVAPQAFLATVISVKQFCK